MQFGSKLGVNVSAELNTESVDDCVALGITWIRADGFWAPLHPTEAAYNADVAAGGLWSGLAALKSAIDYAHSKHVKVLLVAVDSPAWAHGTARTDGGNSARQAILPTKRTQFAEFCRQLALAGADAIEILNEPNFAGGGGYSFGPDHPRVAHPTERVDDYVLLLRAAYARVKGDPLTAACLVGIGGIAKIGHDQIAVAPDYHSLEWYQHMFASKADDRTTPVSIFGSFDFANLHTYADTGSVSGPLAWGSKWINQPNDAIYWHGIANVWEIRQFLIAQGCSDKQIWSTEAGAPTAGTGTPISEALQATWVNDYCTAWFTNGSSGFSAPLSPTFFGDWTGPMFFYSRHDSGNGAGIGPTTTEGFFGLSRYDRSHKPAWNALKTAAGIKYVWAWLSAKTLRQQRSA